jgi:acetylornithine deacetylase/succinyl-diaminopimelate desuccinylase-like protein
MTRKAFFVAATTAATIFVSNQQAWSADDLADIKEQITKQHDQSVKRLQDWIHQVSIAAENRGYPEGADYMIKLLQEAGFDQVRQVPTEGKPGVFATLDAGAPKTVGIYFMYDVKQFDPAEWTSPPTDAALVDKPDFGKVVVGRGAVNQKGPESAFLGALHAIRAAGKKLPVNLAFVAEGEEEIGSPHFPQIVHRPEVQAALAKCEGVFIPSAEQDPDGTVTLTLARRA